jgi:VCBS repeat-containing protein
VSYSVNKANTNINITQDSPDPSTSGDPVTVGWQLTVSSPGAGTPTGTVTVTLSGGSATCNAPVSAGSCVLPGPTVTGSRTITASYSGDGNFNGDTDTDGHTINATNSAPTATADNYSVNEDATLTVNSANGVLSNDSDPDSGDDLDAIVETQPQHGQLSLNGGNGSFSYKPDDNFNGSDSFTYHATDGLANSNTVTVTLTVNPVNDAPVAQDDAFSSGALGITIDPPGVLSNDSDVDGDGLTAVLDNDVGNGTLSLNPNGGFTYTPNALFTGDDSFKYHANDGTANSGQVTVTIHVQ